MQKIEYGDINKFLVSIGIVLIALALLAPYFFLKEDFGIYLETESIQKYEEPIRQIITKKQEQIIFLQKNILKVSLALLILGFVSSLIGLFRWFERQSKIDEKFDKEIKRLDLEIESLTPEEKEEKAKKEVQEIELEETQAESLNSQKFSSPNTTIYSDYIKIEQNVTQVFENYKSPNFEVLAQQRLGNKFEVDLLLKAKHNSYSDRIVEIKYFRNKLPLSIVNKALSQLNTYISYYKNAANKRVIPVLLVVYNKENVNEDDIVKFKRKIANYAQGIPYLKRLKVEFIAQEEIESFDVRKLLKR